MTGWLKGDKGGGFLGGIEVSLHARSEAGGSLVQTATVRPDTPELRAVLEVIRSAPLERLAAAAAARRGYCNTDGGFGLAYERDPEDPEGAPIPEGSVEVFTYWGPPKGEAHQVPEAVYLQVLSLVLFTQGRAEESEAVMKLAIDRSGA